KPHNKTPYELLQGRLPSIGFMRPFGCHVTILNTLDPLGKFQGKVDEGFLVGYSVWSKAFRVFNSRTRIVQETLHVNFMENKPNVVGSGPAWLFDIDSLSQTMNYHLVIPENQTNSNASFQDIKKQGRMELKHIGAQIKKQGDKTKNKDKGKSPIVTIIGFRDLNAEFEECNNNSSNRVNAASSSVSTAGKNSINSTNDFSAAGPSNAAMPNLEDLFHDANDVGVEADINNLESIISVSPIPITRIHKDHPTSQINSDLSSTTQTRSMVRAVRDQVYQIDVKSAYLYGTIEEEVYVCQPLGFEDPKNPDKVYKVVKALYRLHQASRDWYETLATYLLENRFHKGTIDQTLFIKKQQKDILLVQIYVDDIIFGLEVKQKNDGIFISQDKYVAEILRKFGLFEGKSASTPIDAEKPLLKDSDGEDVDVHTYRSMIGSLMYLTSSRPDIMFAVCACARFQVTLKVSHLNAVKRIFRYLNGKPYLGLWYPKDSPFDLVSYSDSDYAVVATSSREAEYVAAASGYAQVLWIQNQLLDYGAASVLFLLLVSTASSFYCCCYLRNVVIEITVLNILSDALSITTNCIQLTMSNPQERVDSP
nr:hypothetical protein [Tanacetum cinerariifolium]